MINSLEKFEGNHFAILLSVQLSQKDEMQIIESFSKSNNIAVWYEINDILKLKVKDMLRKNEDIKAL